MGIKKIAKLANVSIGTVDRVLHKRPGVSESTEKKVLKIIEDIGYVRNTTASRLKLASIKKIRYAILIPVTKHKWNYWKLPKKGFTKALEELRELGVTADFYEFSNPSTFVGLGKAIFNGNYDAIVTVPFFQKESEALLQQANTSNIPVIFLDTEIQMRGQAHFIRQNSHIAGRVAGRLLHGLVGDDGEFFVVNILNENGIHANNVQRENGFRDFFNTIGFKTAIRTVNYTLNEEFRITNDMENGFRTKNRKGIFVTNSKSHLLPDILENYGAANTFIVGFDLNKQNIHYLKKGKINFLINQQPEVQGYLAIKTLFDFLTKKTPLEPGIDIPVEIIVKENVVRL